MEVEAVEAVEVVEVEQETLKELTGASRVILAAARCPKMPITSSQMP